MPDLGASRGGSGQETLCRDSKGPEVPGSSTEDETPSAALPIRNDIGSGLQGVRADEAEPKCAKSRTRGLKPSRVSPRADGALPARQDL